jgi:MoxR-like ATPase
LEQEGTYPLPEAQMDRFMFKILVDYPTKADEMMILNRMGQGTLHEIEPVLTKSELLAAKSRIDDIYVDEKVKQYIVDIVLATRAPEDYGLAQIKNLISVGCSPRATISLVKAARAHAFIRGRGYVTAEDVKAIALKVMRHRLILTYEAEAEDVVTDDVVSELLGQVEVS